MGCGSDDGRVETAPVTGKVTYNGDVVTTGTVMFTPTAGGPSATGEIEADGTFEMKTYDDGDGAAIGSHSVTITALDEGSGLPEEAASEPKLLIPRKFGNAKTSGLTATVNSGDNTVDFALAE